MKLDINKLIHEQYHFSWFPSEDWNYLLELMSNNIIYIRKYSDSCIIHLVQRYLDIVLDDDDINYVGYRAFDIFILASGTLREVMSECIKH
jgi:hypothetical protein